MESGEFPEQTSRPSTSRRSGWPLLRHEVKKAASSYSSAGQCSDGAACAAGKERKTSYAFITKSFKISNSSYSVTAVSSCKIRNMKLRDRQYL